jgi:hypothetical protein
VQQDLLIDKKSPAGELAVISPGGAPKVQTMVPGQLANWCDYSNPIISHAYTVLEAGTAGQVQLKTLWAQVNSIVYHDAMIFPLYNATATGAYNNARVGGVKMLLDNGGQGIPIFQTMYVRNS